MATRIDTLEIWFPDTTAGIASWRAWCQNLHTAIAAMGWVQTADTGQVNLATVARPGAGGYTAPEIWKSDDALSVTHPIYLKVEYGNQPGPAIRIQLGLQGTNGAGGLVGVSVSVANALSPSVTINASTFRNHYASGDGGRFLWYGPYSPSASGSVTFLIERTKDSQGAPTTDGVVCGGSAGSSYQEQVVRFGGVVPGAADTALSAPLLAATVTNVGQDLALSPHFAVVGKWRYLWRLSHRAVDLADLAEFDMDYLGAVHHFKSFATSPVALTGTGNGLAMIWE